jgi:hypothetical protein
VQNFFFQPGEAHLTVLRKQLTRDEVQRTFAGILPSRGTDDGLHHVFVSYRYGGNLT